MKKKDGKDYEPSSLSNMQSGIDRYLKEKFSIIQDRATSQVVLERIARLLRENGRGKRPNKASSLTKNEEEILLDYGHLRVLGPQCL